jgi:hypothetical protein
LGFSGDTFPSFLSSKISYAFPISCIGTTHPASCNRHNKAHTAHS